MSWKDKVSEWGGAEMLLLSEDGESAVFAIAGEPELYRGVFQRNPTERVLIPVVTLEGLTILVTGKRVFRRLAKYEEKFSEVVFELIRHGASGDKDSTYELKPLEDQELKLAILDKGIKDCDPAEIPELMAEVRKALG